MGTKLTKSVIFFLIIFMLNGSLGYADQKTSVNILVYGSGCYSCFQGYINEVEVLEERGLANVEERYTLGSPQVGDELQYIREKYEIPITFQRDTTIVIDERYIIEGRVAVGVIEELVTLKLGYFDSLVVCKQLDGTYVLMADGGEPRECTDISLDECIESEKPNRFFNQVALVVTSGLLDGINPCAFSVLILFIGLLLSSKDNQGFNEVIKLGGVYVLTVFFTYLAIGLSLYRIVEISRQATLLFKLGALAMTLAGILNILEFIRGSGFTLRIPFAGQMKIYDWMSRLTVPSIIISAIMVAVFEFPCTGAVYFGIIGLLASTTTWFEGYGFLLLYNLAFIFPLILILLAVVLLKDVPPSLGARTHGYLKLFSGLVFLSLGLYFLYY